MQAVDSIQCGSFCIGFIGFMLKAKGILEQTNLFPPNKYAMKDKIITIYFQQNLNKLKFIIMFTINIENFEKLKYRIF